MEQRTAVISGASGYIGQAVCRVFAARGWQTLRLGRKMVGTNFERHWSLGEPLPCDLRSIDCVINLASATLVSALDGGSAAALDFSGTKLILNQLRTQRPAGPRRSRFIFISSQSASPVASNSYGKSKWSIEQLLTEPDELIIRPGLVFGSTNGSVFGQLSSLVRKLPVLPDFGGAPAIQPIHVDDLALAIALIAERADIERKLWCLGYPEPLGLKDLWEAVAHQQGLRRPIIVKLPRQLITFAAEMVDLLVKPVPTLSERNGIIGLKPFESKPSLDDLDLQLRPFGQRDR